MRLHCVLPGVGAKEPGGQGWQADTETLANWPEGQTVQESLEGPDTLPGLHVVQDVAAAAL